MTTILPREPGLSELLGSSIGQGFGQGFQSGMKDMMGLALKLQLQKAKMNDPEQQARRAFLNRQTLSTGYNQEIDTLRKLLDPTVPLSKDEREQIKQRLSALYQQKDQHLSLYDQMFGNLYSGMLPKKPEQPNDAVDLGQPQQKTATPSKKQKFDANNPKHRSRAQELYNQLKDKKKVQDILSRDYEF